MERLFLIPLEGDPFHWWTEGRCIIIGTGKVICSFSGIIQEGYITGIIENGVN